MHTFISETVHSFPLSSSHTALYSSCTRMQTHTVPSASHSHWYSFHTSAPPTMGEQYKMVQLWLKQEMKSGFVISLSTTTFYVLSNTYIYNNLFYLHLSPIFVSGGLYSLVQNLFIWQWGSSPRISLTFEKVVMTSDIPALGFFKAITKLFYLHILN